MSLNEELGLINTIFTDKTGTLTTNELEFKVCGIGSVRYDGSSKSITVEESKSIMVEESKSSPHEDNLTDISPVLDQILQDFEYKKHNLGYKSLNFGPISIDSQKDLLEYFWLAISVCHEVIPVSKSKQEQRKLHDDEVLMSKEVVKNDPRYFRKQTYNINKLFENEPEKQSLNEELSDDLSVLDIDENEELVYHGMSPDEITLLNTAKKLKYEFRYRSNRQIVVKINNQDHSYNLMKLIPFSSDRKRMTIIIQDPADTNSVMIFTKGADNVMNELSTNSVYNQDCARHISNFAKRGYRTLLVGMKTMPFLDYTSWEHKYNTLVEDLNENNNDAIEQCITELEQDLHLIGSTALEDRLQDNVYECIEEFRRADIKVWMITGDKLETAKNVGISCRLLQNPVNRHTIRGITEDNAKDKMELIYEAIRLKSSRQENHLSEENKQNFSKDSKSSPANKSNRVTPRSFNLEQTNNEMKNFEINDDIVKKFYDKNSKLDLAEKK